MRKKGTHIITVDGVRYRYRIREHRDTLELLISVQRVDPEGQVLRSGFVKPYKPVPGPGYVTHEPIPHAVKPSTIRQLIEAALERGWQPSQRGLPAFFLAGQEVVAKLPPPG
jgi:hypothetical protein